MRDNLTEAKGKDIIEFLEMRGSTFKRRAGAMVCSSPFSSDTTPSFYVYPENRYKCYSTGRWGDIVNLVQELLGMGFGDAIRHLNADNVPKFEAQKYAKYIKKRKPFVLDNFIVNNLKESLQIDKYAKSRRITNNYERCFYYVFNEVTNEFDRKLAVGFVHVNTDGEIVGCKMRNIDKDDPARFTMRGRIGIYMIDVSTLDMPKLFVCEGEANACSLAEFFKENDYSAIVVSLGGVGSIFALHDIHQFNSMEKFIIIDWDGDEELYKERLEMYKDIKGEEINLKLDKGVDINSLYIDKDYVTLRKLLRI